MHKYHTSTQNSLTRPIALMLTCHHYNSLPGQADQVLSVVASTSVQGFACRLVSNAWGYTHLAALLSMQPDHVSTAANAPQSVKASPQS